MKIIISWSGLRSKTVAQALRKWLPSVMQKVEAWMSAEDIQAGARWNHKLSEELANAHFGILCLTAENQNAPWVLFEAGALAKALATASVCPYLIDLTPADLGNSPLIQFQAKQANRAQTCELVHTINKALESAAYPDDIVQIIFDNLWPNLEKTLGNLLEKSPEQVIKHPLEYMLKDTIKELHEIKREFEIGKVVEQNMSEEILKEVRDIRHDIEVRRKEENSRSIVLDHTLDAALKRSQVYCRELQEKLDGTDQHVEILKKSRQQDQHRIIELQEELKIARQRIVTLEGTVQEIQQTSTLNTRVPVQDRASSKTVQKIQQNSTPNTLSSIAFVLAPLPLKDSLGPKSQFIAQLKKGDKLIILDEQTNHYKVKTTDNRVGWIPIGWVSKS